MLHLADNTSVCVFESAVTTLLLVLTVVPSLAPLWALDRTARHVHVTQAAGVFTCGRKCVTTWVRAHHLKCQIVTLCVGAGLWYLLLDAVKLFQD